MIEVKIHRSSKVALVDDSDYDLVKGRNWTLNKKDNCYYAVSKRMSMHRLILGLKKGEVCDHKYGNGLNNQRDNIRKCTTAQNSMNNRKHKGRSKFKGVSFSEQRSKWQSKIWLNGKTKFLGDYTNEIDAAKAYDEEAKKQFGDFARLNF